MEGTSLLRLEEADTPAKEATPLPSSAALQILTFLFFFVPFSSADQWGQDEKQRYG